MPGKDQGHKPTPPSQAPGESGDPQARRKAEEAVLPRTQDGEDGENGEDAEDGQDREGGDVTAPDRRRSPRRAAAKPESD